MGNSNSTSADIAGLQAIAKSAIKARFPKAKLLNQFAKMAEATGTEAEAAEVKRQTARLVCVCAEKYRIDALKDTSDVATILDCWREHWKALIAEMHAAGSPFVELGEENRDGEAKPVMTKYGRNVASSARGMIEHAVCLKDAEGNDRPYTALTAEIVKSRRAGLSKEARELNTAKDAMAEAVADLRKSCKKDSDVIALATTMVGLITKTITEFGEDGLIYLALHSDEFRYEDYSTESKDDSDDNPTLPGESGETDHDTPAEIEAVG